MTFYNNKFTVENALVLYYCYYLNFHLLLEQEIYINKLLIIPGLFLFYAKSVKQNDK